MSIGKKFNIFKGSSNNMPKYDWGDIKREVEDNTPKEEDFFDVYERQEVLADKKRVEEIKSKLGIEKRNGLMDASVQEYATIEEMSEMDWFGEDARAEKLVGEKGAFLKSFMTAEYDDMVNHIDGVCVINNSYTKFKPVAFALDITYNSTDEGLTKKMNWKHPYKKYEKVIGAAKCKYFEDTDVYKGEEYKTIKKGAINILPRFVIGYNPELAIDITKYRMSKDGYKNEDRMKKSMEARLCCLLEIVEQSGAMLKDLDQRVIKENPELKLDVYRNNLESIHEFVASSADIALGVAKNSGMDIIESVKNDKVYNEILRKNKERFNK